MKNKKNFNNLFHSVCSTLLLATCVALYLFSLWEGVINHKEGTDPIVTLIICTLFFGTMIIIELVLIILYGYEYWFLTDDAIYSKKPFKKKVIIKLSEIENVEKNTISTFVFGTYITEAYIICSNEEKITIFIDKEKKLTDLECVLNQFII